LSIVEFCWSLFTKGGTVLRYQFRQSGLPSGEEDKAAFEGWGVFADEFEFADMLLCLFGESAASKLWCGFFVFGFVVAGDVANFPVFP